MSTARSNSFVPHKKDKLWIINGGEHMQRFGSEGEDFNLTNSNGCNIWEVIINLYFDDLKKMKEFLSTKRKAK